MKEHPNKFSSMVSWVMWTENLGSQHSELPRGSVAKFHAMEKLKECCNLLAEKFNQCCNSLGAKQDACIGHLVKLGVFCRSQHQLDGCAFCLFCEALILSPFSGCGLYGSGQFSNLAELFRAKSIQSNHWFLYKWEKVIHIQVEHSNAWSMSITFLSVRFGRSIKMLFRHDNSTYLCDPSWWE